MSSFDLTDRVAIITGASKGIGKEIALILAQNGAKVVISSRNQESVDAVAKEFTDQGLEAVGIAAHMGSQDDIENLVNSTISKYGGIDIIVNNAATNPVYGPLLTNDDETFDKIMSINVRGPLNLAKLAHPSMKERGHGSVINISSVGGIRPEPLIGLYSMSKASLISITKIMAQEWGEDNIRANVICPGLIQTKFSKALWENEKVSQSYTKHLPLKRIGQPEEIAGLALFLASSASSYCTGAIYTADGGHTV
jgi:dehydrogenase/reductase SDR family member 4